MCRGRLSSRFTFISSEYFSLKLEFDYGEGAASCAGLCYASKWGIGLDLASSDCEVLPCDRIFLSRSSVYKDTTEAPFVESFEWGISTGFLLEATGLASTSTICDSFSSSWESRAKGISVSSLALLKFFFWTDLGFTYFCAADLVVWGVMGFLASAFLTRAWVYSERLFMMGAYWLSGTTFLLLFDPKDFTQDYCSSIVSNIVGSSLVNLVRLSRWFEPCCSFDS